MLSITHHAQARLQQRGIPTLIVESLFEFGRHAHDHRGKTILFFDHRTRNTLRRQITHNAYKHIESHLNTFAVLSADGAIVTVGHRTQRINRH